MSVSPSRTNGRLAALLRTAGWRPETLARRLNSALARRGVQRRVHEKTPYKWIGRGEVPHGDLPELVVQMLSTAVDMNLAYEDVWGDRRRPPLGEPADHAMDLPWNGGGLLTLLGGPVPTRRTVIAVTGAALTSRAWAPLHHPAPTLSSVGAGDGAVTPPLLAMIDSVVAQAQQLDNQHGGAARVFVGDQFAAVARLLRRASYDAATGRHLAGALAQLAQTAGFMAFDGHDDGLAQRWYLTALRAAHAAADPALTASILALMSNQAAERGHALDAVQLASAAQEAAARTPRAVRSLVAARSGLAHAAAGDLTSFSRMRDCVVELGSDLSDAPLPSWASYVDSTELDAITGRGLVVLAERLPQRRRRLLRQAVQLLHTRAHTDLAGPQQRSALRHGAWLSLAYIAANDLEPAVSAARLALKRVPSVSSVRGVALLRRVHDDLVAVAPRSPQVRPLISDLSQLRGAAGAPEAQAP